jgi:hypothetical protein
MLDYAQSFEEFSRGLKPVDLALYAGVALVAWVFLKDKLNPVQGIVKTVVDKLKNLLNNQDPKTTVVTTPSQNVSEPTGDVFFDLVVSWKQTRDLALKSDCSEAVKVADQMFPYLSPTVCAQKENKDE